MHGMYPVPHFKFVYDLWLIKNGDGLINIKKKTLTKKNMPML